MEIAHRGHEVDGAPHLALPLHPTPNRLNRAQDFHSLTGQTSPTRSDWFRFYPIGRLQWAARQAAR
jgi:hypothetical protein